MFELETVHLRNLAAMDKWKDRIIENKITFCLRVVREPEIMDFKDEETKWAENKSFLFQKKRNE